MAEAEDNYAPIADSLKEGGINVSQPEQKYVPSFKMLGDNKIPVSKSMGKLWKTRRDQAKAKLKNEGILDAWEECIRYYNNDQSTNSGAAGGSPNVSRMARKGTGQSDEHIETENVVFANVTALVPATYAKNPDVEVTPTDKKDENKKIAATCFERLINSLFSTKYNPGVNLKPKARKAVLNATLTNVSYIEIGWTEKDQSSEASLQELSRLAQELEKTKELKRIEEIEGELQALELKVDLLNPAGPWVKFRRPQDVYRDPSNKSADLADCKWIMIRELIPTALLKAIYFTKKDDSDEYESIFAPTHVLKANASGGHDLDNEVNNFSIIADGKDHSLYGYDDEESFNTACFTECWYVWDKTTRRCYLFHDKDWCYPIWVWDDPLGLSRFFPIYCLEFYIDPEGDYARSEVMYYLDQQDAINEIASERRRAIAWARKNIFYDLDAIKDPALISAYLEGGEKGGAIGVKIPEGKKMGDLVWSQPPPSGQFMQLFDPQPYLQAIDRVSSVTNVMRGVEYKTNTTNKAIESYESQTQTRLDEKIDMIEEFIGDIGHGLLELCIQKMDAATVASLTDSTCGEAWAQLQGMAVSEFNKQFNMRIVGGSALKPTARAKKEEAMQIGQTLGQFGKSMPAAVLIMLKVFERAFDEIVITEEDWTMLRQSVEAQLNPQGAGDPNEPTGDQALQRMEMLIDSLPPAAKQAFGKAISQGVPIRTTIEMIQNRVAAQQTQQGPTDGQSPVDEQ